MKSHFLKQSILTITLILISVISIISFSSCSKENTDNNEKVVNDSYYLKYVIKGNGTYGHFSNWTVTTPQGIYSNRGYQVRSWSQTYGPIFKGFECAVQIDDYISGAPTIEIYVSKNEEPFVLKVIKSGKSASYSIDF